MKSKIRELLESNFTVVEFDMFNKAPIISARECYEDEDLGIFAIIQHYLVLPFWGPRGRA